MITQDYLKECLRYDPRTGDFTWLKRPARHFKSVAGQSRANGGNAGKSAGDIHKEDSGKEYRRIRISHKGGSSGLYRAHRLAWLYMFGCFPQNQIDHINGDSLDNRIENLRDVSNLENGRNQKKPKNNKSGVVGVSWDKKKLKWASKICVSGKGLFLGYFDEIGDAETARLSANKKYGFHENHGK